MEKKLQTLTCIASAIAAIALLANIQKANATAITDVSEIGNFTQIYQLDIPNVANFNGATPAYNVDNSATVFSSSIQRIGFYMELGDSAGNRDWVWASMDAFTQDLSLIGVPTSNAAFWQQIVGNMNVESNVGSIATGTGISTGNIEFWNSCYGTASGLGGIGGAGTYDFNDTAVNKQCYGSMQVHNHGASQTLFAWNGWDNSSLNDIGIGNQVNGSGHPDWTFANNTGNYTLKSLEVWVGDGTSSSTSVPEPSTLLLLGSGLAGLWLRKKKHLQVKT